jgi:hypothetical protein
MLIEYCGALDLGWRIFGIDDEDGALSESNAYERVILVLNIQKRLCMLITN